MRGLGLQKRLLGNLSHSLTPFKSDTDLSLTDVSALENVSPQVRAALLELPEFLSISCAGEEKGAACDE